MAAADFVFTLVPLKYREGPAEYLVGVLDVSGAQECVGRHEQVPESGDTSTPSCDERRLRDRPVRLIASLRLRWAGRYYATTSKVRVTVRDRFWPLSSGTRSIDFLNVLAQNNA